MRGPQAAELRLSEAEQKELEALVRRQSTPQQLARRAQMILAANEGKRNGQIAREQDASVDTVRKWRMHWIGLQAISLEDLCVSERLADLPRPGRPSQISAEQICQLMRWPVSNPKSVPLATGLGARLLRK